MKILAFVDVHGSLKALDKIKAKAKDVDIVVCSGDISIFENNLDKLLMELNKLNKTILIVPGNHEEDSDLSQVVQMFDNITDIHKKSFVDGNYLFLGYGGSGFSMVDKEFIKASKKFEKEIGKNKDKKVILVTHAPPYKTKLDNIMGEYCGNKSIKNFVVKVKPDLVIAGHLHENSGKEDKIKGIKLINPGPFGKIVDI
jgi:putative phosphoesterase